MIKLPEKFVDAHHHLWNPSTNDPEVGYVWLKDIGAMKPFGDPTAIQRDYLPEEFLSEAKGSNITGSVHLQADGAIPDPVAETEFVQSLCDAIKTKTAIIGFVDLSSDNAQRTLERHLAFNRFRGVRQILSKLDDKPEISFAQRHYLSDPLWQDQFSLLKEHELSFDLQIYPEQMQSAAEFFAYHPETPVIIDHAGSPRDQSNSGLKVWREGIASLAKLPNTHVKLCGFGMFDENWSALTITPIVESLKELFGPERMMFGSNFPVDKLMASYDYCLTMTSSCLQDLSDSQFAAVYHDNAERIYRL